jgi:mannose-6-phosphate isomerase
MHAIRFEPRFKRYLWGGRRLSTMLHKPIGEGDDYAESWEICDREEDQSVAASEPWAGMTLSQLLQEHGPAILGRHIGRGRFPLLFKFLDAHKTLSVQVHPNDAQAARRTPPDLGKTEAWVVLAAEPGSLVYAGLKRGFDRQSLERELARGTCELCLHRFEPQPGDCLFIPAGTVHALGAGLVVAEIQQSSDTTYRLFDWNRSGADGKPRPLHVAEALDVIDFDRGPVDPVRPVRLAGLPAERLVESDKFVLDRWTLSEAASLGGDGRFHLVAVLSGRPRFDSPTLDQPLAAGDCFLLPASAPRLHVQPAGTAVLLDACLP